MQKHLILLADFLDSQHLESEANQIDQLIKQSLNVGVVPPHLMRPTQTNPVSKEPLHMILDVLGLIPGVGEGADFVNAALYLSEGITAKNLLLAAISITSLIPQLGDLSKLIKYGQQLAPDVVLSLARMVLQHKEKIRATFAALKNTKVAESVTHYVTKGALLTKYSDQMFESLRKWALKIIQDGSKQIAGETVKQNVE